MLMLSFCSLCLWRRLYLDLACARGRSEWVRIGERTLESRAIDSGNSSFRTLTPRWYVLSLRIHDMRTDVVLSTEPNVESGANIDACVLSLPFLAHFAADLSFRMQKVFRDDRAEYDRIIRAFVMQQLDI